MAKITDAEIRMANAIVDKLVEDQTLTLHGLAISSNAHIAIATIAHVVDGKHAKEYIQSMITAHDILLELKPYLASAPVEDLIKGDKFKETFH